MISKKISPLIKVGLGFKEETSYKKEKDEG